MTVIEMVIFAALLAGFNLAGGLLATYAIMKLMTNKNFVMKYYKKMFKLFEDLTEEFEKEFEKNE